MRRIIRGILLALLIFSAVAHVGAKEQYLIGFSQCTMVDIWREAMVKEMRIELGIRPDLEMVMRDAADNSEKQIRDIRELMAMDIDLLIVSPNETEPLTPVVQEVYQAGIPVIIIDRKINSEDYTVYIGADNYQVGREAGIYVTKLLKGRGKILEIWGLLGSSPASERHAGFTDAISRFPEIEIVSSGSGKWLWQEGMQVMKDHIASRADFDLVFAHNDFMAHGAYLAAKEAGKEDAYYIVGIDGLLGLKGGIQRVLEGKQDATVLYPTGGYEAIQTADKILHNKPFSREVKLNTVLIDSTNARIFKMQNQGIMDLQSKIQQHRTILDDQIEKYNSQKTLFTISLVLLALVIALIILLFRSYRIKMKVNSDLVKQKEEIEKQNHEIRKQQEQLMKVNKELEHATQMKLRFFTNISHEFRTPLTLIIGPLEQIISDKRYPVQDRKRFGMMHRNAIRLLRLINQLMDLRKMESGKLEMQAGNYNLSQFVHEVKENFDELAQQKNIFFRIYESNPDVWLFFDKDKLDKIMFNLLSNAFKNTPEGGSITINITEGRYDFGAATEEGVEIIVSDTGTGMSEAHINNIFERFYQIDKQQKDKTFPGTGIGLSLTKGLVALHKGLIAINSEKGKGTAVSVRLRKGTEHLRKEEMMFEDAEGTEATSQSIPEETQYTPDLQEWAREGEDGTLKGSPLVLIVEDNSDVRQYIADSLGEGYRILEAANGREGLKKIQEEQPDLVVSDIMMPEMDGLEMTKAIKSDMNTCHIPVILLTALVSLDKKLDGIEYGADSYIAKPFNSRHLQVRARKLIETRQRIREHYRANADSDPGKIRDVSPIDKDFLNKVKEIIKKNMKESDLSVEMLSGELGMSRVHLYRKMKHLTGMTVSEYIRALRLRHAAMLLKTSRMTVSEVAYETGFSNPSYFTKCFREAYNVSPSGYHS